MSEEITSLKHLAAAYIKAQMEMAPLLKDTKGNFGKYATLASVQDVCIPAFSKYGIAVFQSVATHWEENRVYVRINCTLFHADSGECIVYEPLDLVPTKTDPQGIGSAITYGRRYSMMAIAGIAPEDDDGTEASKSTPKEQTKQTQQRNNASNTPSHRQPEATPTPASNGNGHAPALVIPKEFANADAAIKWGYDSKAFEALQHAKNAYDKLKAEKKPATAATMFDLWIQDVKRRLEEKQTVTA